MLLTLLFTTLTFAGSEGITGAIPAVVDPSIAKKYPELSYQWVVESGRAVGCIETTKVKFEKDPYCDHLPFASLECASFEKNEVIKDVNLCRKRLQATPYWLGDSGTFCADFIEFGERPNEQRVFIRQVPNDRCPHKWLTIDETCKVKDGGVHFFHPLSGFSVKDLIPEIMNLKDQETVPPEVYEKYDSKKIAMTINYRHYDLREKAKTEAVKGKEAYDYLNDGHIQMAFPEQYLDSILEKGFLNQHQINSSKGCLCPDTRARVEDKLLEFNLEAEYKNNPAANVNKVRPKYSFFGLNKIPADSKNYPTQIVYQKYGNIVAVLKNQVKDRSTFTMADSLNYYGGDDVKTIKGNDEKLYPHKFEAKNYVEAQIWGEVTVKDDVDYFLVNCHKASPASEVTIQKLKSTGKRVYECRPEGQGGFNGYPAPKKISPGAEL